MFLRLFVCLGRVILGVMDVVRCFSMFVACFCNFLSVVECVVYLSVCGSV